MVGERVALAERNPQMLNQPKSVTVLGCSGQGSVKRQSGRTEIVYRSIDIVIGRRAGDENPKTVPFRIECLGYCYDSRRIDGLIAAR